MRKATAVSSLHPLGNVKKPRPAIHLDNRGANVVEYIIVVGLIALIALAGFRFFGSSVDTKIEEQAQCVKELGECGGTNTGSGSTAAAKGGSGESTASATGASTMGEGATGTATGASTKGAA